VTPNNWHLSSEEARYIVDDCGAAVLVASATCADVVAGTEAPALKGRLAVGGPIEGFASYELVVGSHPTTPIDDECEGNWMFYSSGTTGRPKGITPASVGEPLGASNGFTSMVRFLYGGDERTRYASPSPLYHAAPSAWATSVHRLGGTVVVTERFDPVEFLEV
nr:AMP-binding protein [Micromonospora sp. DSM 115978]